jgi:hypothetical protein
MENKLISVEKWAKLIDTVEYMSTCEQLRGGGQAQYKAILAMPDFVQSEEDVVELAVTIFHSPSDDGLEPITTWEEVKEKKDVDGVLYSDFINAAQAVINALRG